MIHQKSADTKILESVLREAKVGDKVTYAALSAAIGRDVREFGRGALRTARHTVIKEGFVFGVEANEGLVRLDDTGILATTESDRRRLKRISNRSMQKLEVVKYDGLSEADKRKHTTAAAVMGAVSMFSGKSASNRIEAKVTDSSKPLAIGETLAMFS